MNGMGMRDMAQQTMECVEYWKPALDMCWRALNHHIAKGDVHPPNGVMGTVHIIVHQPGWGRGGGWGRWEGEEGGEGMGVDKGEEGERREGGNG